METLIINAAFYLALFGYLATCIVITGQQTTKIIETFGKFSRAANAGLSLKLPWPFQIVRGIMSLRICEIGEDVGVKSVDNAFLTVPIRVQFAANPDKARDAYYKLDDPEGQIRSYVVNEVRSAASGMTFEELFKSRSHFEDAVEETLKDRMESFGYVIENVLVDDPQPSSDLRAAFDRVIAAQREKEAAENEGEAKRILAVAEANAEGEALRIKAQAFSDFRKTVAEGNGEALRKFCGETDMAPEAGLEFFTNINEMEAVRDAAHNGGRIVFVAGSAKGAGTDPALMGVMQTPEGASPVAQTTAPAADATEAAPH